MSEQQAAESQPAGQQPANPMFLGRSPAYVDIYASLVRLSMTPTDFTLIFGAFEDFGPGQIYPQDRAAVRLSPQSLRILIENASSVLRAWEAQFGKVNLPKAIADEAKENEKRLSTIFGNSGQHPR